MDVIAEHELSNGRVNVWAIAVGAAAGALACYVLGTPRGRRAFDEVIAILDDFSSGCARFSQACARAQFAASDSWHAATDVFQSKSTR